MVSLDRKEVFIAIDVLKFLISHVTDDGTEEDMKKLGYTDEVNLLNKLRNGL